MSPLRCAWFNGGGIACGGCDWVEGAPVTEGGVAGMAKALFLLVLLLLLVAVAVAVGREWPETESRDLFLDGSASERPCAGGWDD